MTSSRALSLTFVALLVVSLAGKALTRPSVEPDRDLFTRTVERRMTSAGFAVRQVALPSGDYLFGARGACRVMVSEQDALGQFADRNRQLARSVGPMRLVWRGRVLERTPRAEIVTRFLWRRQLTRVGLLPPRHPLAAVADNGRCDPAVPTALPPPTLPR